MFGGSRLYAGDIKCYIIYWSLYDDAKSRSKVLGNGRYMYSEAIGLPRSKWGG